MADLTTCRNDILDLFDQIETDADALTYEEGAFLAQARGAVQPLLDVINLPSGVFLTMPPGEVRPTLSETTGRIHNFGAGFAEWSFYENQSGQNRLVLTLPAAIVDSSKAAVHLNAARLTETDDYSISGDQLTFVYPIDQGDLVTVKSYGV